MALTLDEVVNGTGSLGCNVGWIGEGGNGMKIGGIVRVKRKVEGMNEKVIGVAHGLGSGNGEMSLSLEALKTIFMLINPLADGVSQVMEAEVRG
jgi:hypothetical protein